MSTMRVKNKDGTWDKVPVLGSYQAVLAANEAATNAQNAADYAMQAAYSVMRAYYSKADMRKDTTLKIGDICTTTIAEKPDDFLSDIYKIREKLENEYDGQYGAVFLDNGLVAEVVYHSVAYAEGYNYRVFGFLSSLKRFDSSFDDTTATIVDVCKTLPVYSTLQCPINASHKGFASFPYQYGTLQVTKLPNRCFAKFYPHTLENVWVATYYWTKEDYSDAHFGTWYDVSQHQELQSKNSQRACDELIRVAETWLNRTFIYGRNCTSTDNGSITGPTIYKVTYNGTAYNEIDCAAFVRQVFAGIEYGRSKYYDSRNPWRFQKNYSWAIDLPWTWNGLLEMGYKNGWMVEAGENYERLQKGDLVFWKVDDEDNPNQVDFVKRAYRHIGHVGIFTGRFVTERENAIAKGITDEATLNALDDTTLHPQTIEVQWVDNTPRTDVITYRLLDETTYRNDNIVMYVRVPLQENVGINTRDVVQYCQIPMYKDTKTRNSKTIFSYYHKADVVIKGDGNDIVIHNNTNNQYVTDEIVIGGILVDGTESIYTSSVRTGFVHINYTYTYAVDKGLDASKFYIFVSRYYDKNMNWVTNEVTDNNKASLAFRRSVIYKTDKSEVMQEDLQEIKNTLYRVDDRFEQGYSKGLGYTIKIEASKIPKGYTCKRYNGNYCISADNKNWTPVDSETNAKLESIYFYDGENNFVVTTGQEVSLI